MLAVEPREYIERKCNFESPQIKMQNMGNVPAESPQKSPVMQLTFDLLRGKWIC